MEGRRQIGTDGKVVDGGDGDCCGVRRVGICPSVGEGGVGEGDRGGEGCVGEEGAVEGRLEWGWLECGMWDVD